MKKDLTLIIPWADRDEIKRTLTENTRFLHECHISFEIFVINCGGNFLHLSALLENEGFVEVTLVDLKEKRFNKSKTLNKGIQLATASHFMCLDVDILFQDLDFKKAIQMLDNGNFITLKNVFESEPQENLHTQLPFEVKGLEAFSYKMELVMAGGSIIEVVLNRNRFKENARSAPGILLAALDDLKAIEGYNSELEGWGWEDIDLIVRLMHHGFKRIEMGTAIHLTHANEHRHLDPNTESKSENEAYNLQKCLINYQLGLFSGTLIRDTK